MTRRICILLSLFAVAALAADEVVHESVPGPETLELGIWPIEASKDYLVEGGYVAKSYVPGAAIALTADVLDGGGNVILHRDSTRQMVGACDFEHRILMTLTSPRGAVSVRLSMTAAANPVTFTPLAASVRPEPKDRFRGLYDPPDPPPTNMASALAEMAGIPPAVATIGRRKGRNVAIVDGEVTPLNEYKGMSDYRLMGECGGDVVMSFNCGQRMFQSVAWDKSLFDPETGRWDFSRIEQNLVRIHAANPRARVILAVDLDPHKDFLERHPDSIFTDERGVRGRSVNQAFGGFDSTPLDPSVLRVNWAYSYASREWQELVHDGLKRLCAYLKTTPASNIVIGFHLAGGMDGQFVQWQYGPQNGHFDYSESNRRALCAYLRELYGTDRALQAAWGDPDVTLATARNPTPAEFHANPVLDDRPGTGRRIADCRRFISVGTARALNGFARLLRREFGRPCLVDTWYTSTIWSQPDRLTLDELTKGDGVNVIVTVSGYSFLRALDGMGASANNSIAGLNLRGLLFVQEMDHRTWRSQQTGSVLQQVADAKPRDAREFAIQVRRDAASVIAAGGAGFHLYDMFGSWYHDDSLRSVFREIFSLNRFATERAGRYPLPRLAIFTDEKARLLREGTYDNVNAVWRTSGVMPAIHYLTDIENPDLPDYDLYVVWQPVTVTRTQVEAFRRRTSVRGKVLAVIGEAGVCSREFGGTADVMACFGLKVQAHPNERLCDYVVGEPGVRDPLLDGVVGMLEADGTEIARGGVRIRSQLGYATVDDPGAKVLGRWQASGRPAFVRKPMGEGLLVFMARDGGLVPALLHNLAKAAGIRPFARPGNATYVGNGVACVHRLSGAAEVDFGRPVRLTDCATGRTWGPVVVWTPDLGPCESAAVAYEYVSPEDKVLCGAVVSAWVTGVKFSRSASRDRQTNLPPPQAVAVFRRPDGSRERLKLADVEWKGRHYVERRLTVAERADLSGAKLEGVRIEGATPEDAGIEVSDVRLFRLKDKPFEAPKLPRRNLRPLKGQDLGCNGGSGVLPFPVDERTILPRAAAQASPLAVRPSFSGGARKPAERPFLEMRERREGRTLTVDLHAPPGKVTEIALGLPNEARIIRPLSIPFLPYGDCHLLEGGLFRYAAVDWYRSNASLVTTNEADGTVLLKYLPKTDGTFNPVCERIVIALSDRFEDVLPDIPNPLSPHRGVTGTHVWRTHAASVRSRDKVLWQRLHDVGITEVCVCDHETMWRDGGEPFTFVTDAAPGKGGDAAQKDFTDFMVRRLGYVYGPYNNYVDLASSSDWWDPDRVSLTPGGTLQTAWVRCYAPKPVLVPDISDRIAGEVRRKFGFACAYCDVHTATAPWNRTDYDARVPGAATFSQAYYAYGDLLLRQRKSWQGPVFSEGNMQFMYAGLTDGNYGRDGSYDFTVQPWLVDFDLLKIHPLECNFGMGALGHFSREHDIAKLAFYQPAMPHGREVLVDSFIAATLAFGHAGYLILDWCWEPAKMFGPAFCGPSRETFEEGIPIAMRSYFMTQAPAARYTQTAVDFVRYLDVRGNLLETSAAILSGAVARNQIVVRYADGTHVVANGNLTERLRVRLADAEIDLPPYGYRVWTDDGTLLVESGDANGTRSRFDYAESPRYVYIDGRGKAVAFRKGETEGGPVCRIVR